MIRSKPAARQKTMKCSFVSMEGEKCGMIVSEEQMSDLNLKNIKKENGK